MRWGIYSYDGFEGAAAFRCGLLEIGHSAIFRSLWDFDSTIEGFDAVATFGLHGKGERLLTEYKGAGVPVAVIDYGYIKRTNTAHDWRTGHWQISIGGLNRIPQFHCPSDRFDRLGVDIVERGGDPNGYALLCVQTPEDKSHGRTANQLADWCKEQAQRWPGLLIRPHPLLEDADYGIEACRAKSMTEALSGARLVLTGNSNSGHDALLAGVPAIADFPGAAWAELSGEHLPSNGARREYFSRAAYGQWTWEEMRTGEPQNFVIERLLAQ